jgi:succinate dehydrogenase/fumarate reductase flavoprotein subunit
MSTNAGVLRDASSLGAACDDARGVLGESLGDSVEAWELHNLATVANALVTAAMAREESRGAHNRADFPGTDPAFERHILVEGPGGPPRPRCESA